MPKADKTFNATNPAARRHGGAFTLIELLAVMLILGILIAIGASVGKYVMNDAKRRETMASQALIMDAIQVYFETKRIYPSETDPNATQHANPANEDEVKENVGIRSKYLYTQLELVEASKAKLDALPANVSTGDSLKDGFGEVMDYQAYEGIGGKPVVTSAGADKKFGYRDEDKEYADDNIRSDGKQ